MIGILSDILCWIKQFGALMLNALIDVVNLIIAGIGAAGQALLDGWPVGMPSLPATPGGLATAVGWVEWSPFPLDALGSFVAFFLTVKLVMLVSGPVLRFFRLIDG